MTILDILEERRTQLEILDRIEEGLTIRIRKSDQFLPSRVNPTRRHLGTHEYSARENFARLTEAQCLVDQYQNISEKVKPMNLEALPSFESQLTALTKFDDEHPAQSLSENYALNGDQKGLRRFFCSATKHQMSNFTSDSREGFGQYVYLEPFYRKMIATGSHPGDITYRDYLVKLPEFYESQIDVELVRYLTQFYNRYNSLGPGTTATDQFIHNENKHPLYCALCVRIFANKSVFDNHLSGKKHKRAIHEQPQLHLVELIELLRIPFENTIARIDRKSHMGIEDRKIEIRALEAEIARENEWLSDEEHLSSLEPRSNQAEHKHSTESMKNVPRAQDDIQIPRWLYKLRGLGQIFACEICGNSKFSGRQSFENHFGQVKHISSLELLGIQWSPVFSGITSIEEAKILFKKIKQNDQKSKNFETEVEDDEGNVMTERMYIDLKKQGLI